MTYWSLPPEERTDPWLNAPSYVKRAAVRKARAFRVLRLYRRRGWNERAVAYEYSQATEQMASALDRWEHEEANPRLF